MSAPETLTIGADTYYLRHAFSSLVFDDVTATPSFFANVGGSVVATDGGHLTCQGTGEGSGNYIVVLSADRPVVTISITGQIRDLYPLGEEEALWVPNFGTSHNIQRINLNDGTTYPFGGALTLSHSSSLSVGITPQHVYILAKLATITAPFADPGRLVRFDKAGVYDTAFAPELRSYFAGGSTSHTTLNWLGMRDEELVIERTNLAEDPVWVEGVEYADGPPTLPFRVTQAGAWAGLLAVDGFNVYGRDNNAWGVSLKDGSWVSAGSSGTTEYRYASRPSVDGGACYTSTVYVGGTGNTNALAHLSMTEGNALFDNRGRIYDVLSGDGLVQVGVIEDVAPIDGDRIVASPSGNYVWLYKDGALYQYTTAAPEPEPGAVETPIFEPFASEPNAEGYALLHLEARGAGFSVPGQALGLVRVELNTSGYAEGDYGGVIEPGIPANGLAGVNFAVGGTGYGRGFGFGGAELTLDTQGYSTADGFGAGGATLLFRTVGVVPSANAGDGYLVDRDPLVSGFGGHWFAVEHDALAMSAHAEHLHTVVLRAMLAYGDTQHGHFEGAFAATDALVLGGHASWLLHLLTEDGMVLGAEATPDYLAVARAIETLLASGVATGYVEAVSLVLDAMVLRTLADGFDYERAVDTALLAAAVADAYTALGGVLDRLLTSPTATGAQRLTTLVRDDVVLDAQAATSADFHAALRDSLGLAAHLSLDTGEYVAWVVNTESAGVSTYQNYPFNSFAKLGGKYYGATSQGLFLLEGEDDDGEAIDSRIRLGLHDMNTRKLKRLPEAYIGYKSDGNMILRVIVADDHTGEKVAMEYLMRPRAAPNLRESRFVTGRGVKAVDWDFEIENIDGADFDLADVEFHPLVMDRRTRG